MLFTNHQLTEIADRVKNFAVLYVCDLDQVPDFKQMYELYDPVTLMFFFRNKHMVNIVFIAALFREK